MSTWVRREISRPLGVKQGRCSAECMLQLLTYLLLVGRTTMFIIGQDLLQAVNNFAMQLHGYIICSKTKWCALKQKRKPNMIQIFLQVENEIII